MCPGGSTRWCPTPEQVMILEEMYRSGIRTPNATQIQQITLQLSFYGKIEGKNVFYWFQNHKARERQKLRKKLTKQLHLQRQQHQLYHQLQQNHHFLHYVDSPASPGFQHLSYCNSASLFPQAGIYEDPSAAAVAAKQLMNHTWMFDSIPEKVEKNEAMMRTYGSDWLMMVDLGPPLSSSPPYCCSSSATSRPPLKTLQLFPVTASNLKEECCNNKINNCSKPPPCNIDTNPTPAKVPLTLP